MPPTTVEANPTAGWTCLAYPVLVVDRAGVVRALNRSAQSLLPAAALDRVLDITGMLDFLTTAPHEDAGFARRSHSKTEVR